MTFWQDHYRRSEVKEVIMNHSKYGNIARGGNGDGYTWYHKSDKGKQHVNLSDNHGYDLITNYHRTLYWTLNLFDVPFFSIDWNCITKEESRYKSREYTRAYSFGVDIDTVDKVNGHGANIKDPEIKAAVEACAQYYADRIREHAPDSVHVLFSGGGIYVLLHHLACRQYYEKFGDGYEGHPWDYWLNVLIDAVNSYMIDIRKDFENEYLQHVGKVKPDILNNSKRVFKSIFSVHKRHDFAVIPLDPDKITIDFDRATLPLSQEVIKSGRKWYQTYDDGKRFLEMLVPYLEKAYEKNKVVPGSGYFDPDKDISDSPILYDDWPPCIKNIVNLRYCGEGQTRALALLAAFLGQIGVPRQEAQQIFYNLANRWGAATSNIFDSYYQKMHVPRCDKLTSKEDIGFPKGISIRRLEACKPVSRCHKTGSPYYYADKKAYMGHIMRRIR